MYNVHLIQAYSRYIQAILLLYVYYLIFLLILHSYLLLFAYSDILLHVFMLHDVSSNTI